jgi:prepilin-type N-terminal cleavage/methylation domain-containing protein
MKPRTYQASRGFTIIEMMIGMAVFLVISGAILQGINGLQKNYRSSEMHNTMQQRLRATMELMAQELGQAGLQASTVDGNGASSTTTAPYTVTAAITATGSQTVALTSTINATQLQGVFVGQWLQVDGGTNQDPVQVTAVSPTGMTITANFGKTHAAGAAVYPLGVFPHGIMAGSTGDPSTATKLVFYGDLHGAGNGLWAVEYNCAPPNLTRTEWALDVSCPPDATGCTATTPTGTTTTLLDTVSTASGSCAFCWPGSTASGCAASGSQPTPTTVTLTAPSNYPTSSTTPAFPQCTSSGGVTCTYSLITQVSFTITTTESDAASGQTLTMSKSYSNIQPRNIIAANNIIANTTNPTTSGELQPDPTSLASITW